MRSVYICKKVSPDPGQKLLTMPVNPIDADIGHRHKVVNEKLTKL